MIFRPYILSSAIPCFASLLCPFMYKKLVTRNALAWDPNVLSTGTVLMPKARELTGILLQLHVVTYSTCKTYPDRISCWDTHREGTLSLASSRICIGSGLRDLQSQHRTLASYEPDINTVLSGWLNFTQFTF